MSKGIFTANRKKIKKGPGTGTATSSTHATHPKFYSTSPKMASSLKTTHSICKPKGSISYPTCNLMKDTVLSRIKMNYIDAVFLVENSNEVRKAKRNIPKSKARYLAGCCKK